MDPKDVQNDPLLKDLNREQLQAVTMPNESCIVLAGAGSGKTKVLTTRIAWKIREGLARDEDFLSVTFTNKAAKEMRGRLATMLGRPVGNMWIGTFHGIANRMLRENSRLAGLPDGFAIMDTDDQKAMITKLMKDRPGAPEDVKAKQVVGFINKAKEAGQRAGRMQAYSPFEEYAVPLYQDYETACAREGVVDFAELLLRVNELLQSNDAFLYQYEGRFPHMQVDEFQDTNATQYEWLKSLKGTTGNIFAVGDDDQSIYKFRGSDPRNMQEFVDEIAGGRIVKLEQNYRSTGAILSAANSVISCNAGRLGKSLWTDASEGNKPWVMTFEDDRDEAEYVARLVRNAMSKGLQPKDIAILYRSNSQSAGYERSLMAHGVPYVIYGGQKFYERMEIKNVIAYLRLIMNVNNDSAFNRVINIPSRKIGAATVAEITAIAAKHAGRTDESGDVVGMPMLEAAAVHYDGAAQPRILDFVRLLSGLFKASAEMNLPDFVDHVIHQTGLLQMYETKKEEEEQVRAANLREMVTAAMRFCQESEIPDAMDQKAIDMLVEFLSTATLEPAAENGGELEEKQGKLNADAVTLMTMHASKGLEFPMVVIGGWEEGTFPSARALEDDDDEEERRLAYVGITRARKWLYCTSAKQRMVHGKLLDLEPSRFLAEIPEDLKSCLSPAVNRKFGGYSESTGNTSSTASRSAAAGAGNGGGAGGRGERGQVAAGSRRPGFGR
jgi:DNA helicase-2/ATP-dependent DNA helicase PcrA